MSFCITQLFIYPIKSLAGIAVQEAELCATGLLHDRRWMLVDRNNRFISQREFHELCLFQTAFTEKGISIRYKEDELIIPFYLTEGSPLMVTIWDDEVSALPAPGEINDWFSRQLNKDIRLVYMPDDTKRLVDTKYTNEKEIVSFADGYPLLVIGQASLDLLQSKVQEKMSIERFRPNLVFSGGEPHCEDTWQQFTINQLSFKGVKPCGRCVITTIDPSTGKTSAEPLKTLARYRQKEHKILFGQNTIAPLSGSIAVGMEILVS